MTNNARMPVFLPIAGLIPIGDNLIRQGLFCIGLASINITGKLP